MATPSTTIPTAVPWIQSGESARGYHVTNSPYPNDISNRALKYMLLASGYNPLASVFSGLYGPVFNVLAYGADKTGAVSSQTAFEQAALAASSAGGGVVYAPEGLYVVTKIPSYNNVSIYGAGDKTEIKISDSSTEGYGIEGLGLTNFHVRYLKLNVNGTARSSYTGTMGGIDQSNGTDCSVEWVVIENTLGSSAGASAVAVKSCSIRPSIKFNEFRNMGTALRPSDGAFIRGDEYSAAFNFGDNGYDTCVVLEGCNRGYAIRTETKNFASPIACTNDTNVDCYDNVIDGVFAYNWNASTGAVQIGTTGGTGNLRNTKISNIKLRRTTGSGPAIYIRKAGTGKAIGVEIDGIDIDGAGSQGILVEGDHVHLNGGRIDSPTNSCVQFQNGTVGGQVKNMYLKGGTYSISTTGTASIITRNNICDSPSQYGIFAFDTSTIKSILDLILTPSVGYIAKDAGASLETYEIKDGTVTLNYGGLTTSGQVNTAGLRLGIVAKSANYTTTAVDTVILATGGAGGITITLLDAATYSGKIQVVKKVDAGVGAVTVGRTGANTLDGATSKTLASQYDSLSFISDGTNWYII